MSVVQFPKREEQRLVWRCNCGCLTFYATAGGELECANCNGGARGYDGEWRKPLPEEPAEPETVCPGDTMVTDLNSPAMSLRRLLKTADPEKMAALIVLDQDGGTHVWSQDYDTPERAAWLDDKLAEVAANMKGR